MEKSYTKVVISITNFHLLAKQIGFLQQILHRKFLIEPYYGYIFLFFWQKEFKKKTFFVIKKFWVC